MKDWNYPMAMSEDNRPTGLPKRISMEETATDEKGPFSFQLSIMGSGFSFSIHEKKTITRTITREWYDK